MIAAEPDNASARPDIGPGWYEHLAAEFNAEHLAHLKSLVQADLRRHDECDGCRPCRRSIADYAPKWLVLAANREPILKAIAKLEKKLADAK